MNKTLSGRVTDKQEINFPIADDPPGTRSIGSSMSALAVGSRSGQESLIQPGGSVSSSAHLNSLPLSQGFDVAHWRLAEKAAVFTIELADTFVSDLKGNG